MNRLHDHISIRSKPSDADQAAIWVAEEGMLLGLLEVYTKKDVWSSVNNDTKLDTCKKKWDKLQHIYSGASSMSTFNTWAALTGTSLNKSSPMLPQLHKLNEAQTTLANNSMNITDLQFTFILIKALPEFYSPVMSTILTTRSPTALTPQMVQEWILNEESWQSSSSALLNKVTPIKGNSNDKNKKKKCNYCKIPGHKAADCCKKKHDAEEKEKKKKEKAREAKKAINVHVAIASSSRIEEISNTESDNLHISLYAIGQLSWCVDSGATHHISYTQSDFMQYTPAPGKVGLRGNWKSNSRKERVVLDQLGIRTVIIRTSDAKITLHNVLHVPDADECFFSINVLLLKQGHI